MRLLAAGVAGCACFLLAPSAAGAYQVVTYPLPASHEESGFLDALVSAPSGLWWPNPYGNTIGHMTPAQASPGTSNGIQEITTDGTFPLAVAAGPDGDVYFTENSGGHHEVSKLDPANADAISPVATVANYPRDGVFLGSTLYLTTEDDEVVTVAQDGTVTPSAVVAHPYAWGLAADPLHSHVWYAEDGRSDAHGQGAIGEFGGGDFLPSTGTTPQELTVDHNGNVWFAERGVNQIGELRGGAITEYAIPTQGSGPGVEPNRLTTAPDGSIWFTEGGNSSTPPTIGTFVPPADGSAIAITLIPTPDGKAGVGITADAAGNVWYLADNELGEVVAGSGGGGSGGTGGSTGGGSPGGGGPGPPAGSGPAPSRTQTTGGTTTVLVHGTPAVPGRPTVARDGTSVGDPLACLGPPGAECSFQVDVITGEFVNLTGIVAVKPGTVPAGSQAKIAGVLDKRRRPRLRHRNVVVGVVRVTLHGGQRRTVRISLNRTGRQLQRRFGVLPATVADFQLGAGRPKLLKRAVVRMRAPRTHRSRRRRRG